jgi:hypothetical protein
MSQPARPLGRSLAGLLALLFCVALVPLTHAEFAVQQRTDADQLLLRNLIGEVNVEGHGGRGFEIEVSVQGADADPERVDVELIDGSSEATLNVLFPLDQSRSYVYPRMGRSTSKFSPGDSDGSSWLSRMFGGRSRKITVSGRGSGLELWADVTVRVPAGGSLRLEHGVGTIRAGDVEGDLDLDSISGSVEIRQLDGLLSVDVGSGEVIVEQMQGREILIDTGSGAVELSDCRSERINIDTGSGRVVIENASGEKLLVDTGSGGVRARGVDVESATIDTGSGAVDLELSGMGRGRFEIDTGSGGINLELPPDASAEIRAESGSGGIRVQVGAGAKVHHEDEHSAVIVVGGGDAEVRLDTGSGAIRIRG